MFCRKMDEKRNQLQESLRKAEAMKKQRMENLHEHMKRHTEELNAINKEVVMKDFLVMRLEDQLRNRQDMTTEVQDGYRSQIAEWEDRIKELRRRKQRTEAVRWTCIEFYMSEASQQKHLHVLNGGEWDTSDIVLSLGTQEYHTAYATGV
jgi:DNA repair exonuclease SbcCD ATPase subunit